LVDSELKRATLYKLIVENIDEYQYFCLMQVLENKHIKKQIIRENDKFNIYVNLHNKSAANVLLKELSEYDINAKIVKFKDKIRYEE